MGSHPIFRRIPEEPGACNFSHLCLCVTGVIFSVVQTNPKIAQALQTLRGEKTVVTSALVVVKNPRLAAGSEVRIKMADGGVEQGSLCIPCFLTDCSSLLCVCTSTPSQGCLSISFPDSQGCTYRGSSSTLPGAGTALLPLPGAGAGRRHRSYSRDLGGRGEERACSCKRLLAWG